MGLIKMIENCIWASKKKSKLFLNRGGSDFSVLLMREERFITCTSAYTAVYSFLPLNSPGYLTVFKGWTAYVM